MSFRCFKSKSAIYGTFRNDNKGKQKSPLFNIEDNVLKSSANNIDANNVNNNNNNDDDDDDCYQLHRSISDLSLFQILDNGSKSVTVKNDNKCKLVKEYCSTVVSSDISQHTLDHNNKMDDMSDYSMEQMIENWSQTSSYSTSITDSQKFISNLMGKKAFDVVKEPLRSLPREISVKYGKDSFNYLISSSDPMIKDHRMVNNNNIKKQHISTKPAVSEKPSADSVGLCSSGPLSIVRSIENRNSGGSSSVATPNSPHQSPLSLCSSSGGKSSDQQCYEDGLSEEELRQIALRQQRQIQLQLEDIRLRQQQINKLKQQFDKLGKNLKISQSVVKLKEIYNQQEIKLKAIRNSKNQATQSMKKFESMKVDITNLQSAINSKLSELKKIEMHIEDLKEYLLFVQRYNTSSSIAPNFEAFTRQKISILPNPQLNQSSQTGHNYQVKCTDPKSVCQHSLHSTSTYPDQNRMYVRQMVYTNETFNNNNNNVIYYNTSDISAFVPSNFNYRPKLSDSMELSVAPPLPAHSYQRTINQNIEKSQIQIQSNVNESNQYQKTKRPPLPSYTDATLISANNRYSMLLLQANRKNSRTPTSSPPVVRRTSIVGLPYGKMPSRFASRNTINNVYIKKSSMETLEKYKKTASEIYKAQLSKFKSSSIDDIRTEEISTQDLQDPNKNTDKIATSEQQIPNYDSSPVDINQVTVQLENTSICSSCSSLSLPEDLVAIQPSTDPSGKIEETAFIQNIDDINSLSENDFNSQNISETEESPLLISSIKRAIEALSKEPVKRILKLTTNSNQTTRNAHFHPHSLLLDAALEAEFDLVKEMSDKVEDISEATDEGITALHNAVCSGREDIVKFLLDLGAHINAGDTDGWTPLHCAASCNNVGMARLLVEYGASIFATSISDSEIPIQKCEVDDDMECEQYLYNQQDLLGVFNDGRVYALFHYQSNSEDEFNLYPNKELKIIDKEPQGEPGWFLASEPNDHNKTGFVPKAYVSCYKLVLPVKVNILLSE